MKYEPLTRHLQSRGTHTVNMTFAEIETVIGARLPNSASTHRAWWSNNPSNNVMTKAWLDAGYETEQVDMASRRLVFRRRRTTTPASASTHKREIAVQQPAPPTPPTTPHRSYISELRRAMANTASVPRGTDLTRPVLDSWDAEQ